MPRPAWLLGVSVQTALNGSQTKAPTLQGDIYLVPYGLTSHTIQLMDAKNTIVGKPVKTDKVGNYTFVMDIKAGEKPRKLNIVVLDKQGTQIHKDILPISLKADVVDTRDIVIAKMDEVVRGKDKILIDPLITKRPLTTKTVVKKTAKNTTVRKPARKKPE